jgi:hypothetical protein
MRYFVGLGAEDLLVACITTSINMIEMHWVLKTVLRNFIACPSVAVCPCDV